MRHRRALHVPGYKSYCHSQFTCHSQAEYCTKDKKPLKVQVYSPITLHAVIILLLNVYVPRVTHFHPALTVVYFHNLILFPYFTLKLFFFPVFSYLFRFIINILFENFTLRTLLTRLCGLSGGDCEFESRQRYNKCLI